MCPLVIRKKKKDDLGTNPILIPYSFLRHYFESYFLQLFEKDVRVLNEDQKVFSHIYSIG